MIFITTLEDYNKDLTKGVKKLKSYNSAFKNIGLLLIAGLIVYSLFWFTQITNTLPTGMALNFENFMISLNKGNNFNLSLGLGGILFGIVFSFYLHSKILTSQMFKYVQDFHPAIISSHKNIFRDHSDDAIDAFREERSKVKLLEILEHYKGHTDFMIVNYENFKNEADYD